MTLPTVGTDAERSTWITFERMPRVRAALVGLTLFVSLAVWVFHSLGAASARDATFIARLRDAGIMTWLYALVLMVDQRWYHSRFARARLASARVPEAVLGWLLGQMLASFGILYYALTADARWFIAGMVVFLLAFIAFPIRR